MPDVTFTVDGKKITAPAGTLLIEACKGAGIEIPAFCYYPGLSLQAACRMCVVRQEKVPKLQTACTTQVAEGQVFFTDTPEIVQARKATLQLLLGNHPLDCPVCDAGGECELQDMTFKYGAADSFYAEPKNHREEQQWSPVVYFDRPRCILCYRCVRMCGEGMDVFALGVENRGSSSVIIPNIPAAQSPDALAHVDCEQCGMCIDACPVGALTSGTYRYKTRPWEMNHVPTICTHCGDGCKTTLGVRATSDGAEIVRGDNRDKSGMNGDFLCNKGRYAFDFANSTERITQPLVRQPDGKLKPVSWEEALTFAGQKLAEASRHPRRQEHRRHRRQSPHQRRGLPAAEVRPLRPRHQQHRSPPHRRLRRLCASPRRYNRPRRLAARHRSPPSPSSSSAATPPTRRPLTAWNLRTNVRLNGAKLYIANYRRDQAPPPGQGLPPALRVRLRPLRQLPRRRRLRRRRCRSPTPAALASFRDAVRAEETLLILIGSELSGASLKRLIDFGLTLPNAKFALLGDYANSRGAADMGLLPDMLPGYTPRLRNQ